MLACKELSAAPGYYFGREMMASYSDEHEPLVGSSSLPAPKSTKQRLGYLGFVLQRAGVRIGLKYGGSFYYASEDRIILENQVLPYYQISGEHHRILFVGTDWPTYGYVRMFAHKSLTTIDYDQVKAPYGAPRHIVGSVIEIGQHFPADSLDLIVMNGVLGWGLDSPADIEKTLAAFATCLRPRGHLILGWNDMNGHRFLSLEGILSLARFRPFTMPSIGKSEIRVDNDWRHIYRFYELAD